MKDHDLDNMMARSTRNLGNPDVVALAVALLGLGLMLFLMLAMGPGSTR